MVFDNGMRDSLAVSTGTDWFFADLDNADPSKRDLILALATGETILIDALPSDTSVLVEIRLTGGRSVRCSKYVTSYTYDGFLERTVSEECNEMMLQAVESEARRYFPDWPLHVIPPRRPPGEIDYPAVRFMALFESSPVREMDLSGLVLVWFQDRPWPVPDDDARRALESLAWDRLAIDYEL